MNDNKEKQLQSIIEIQYEMSNICFKAKNIFNSDLSYFFWLNSIILMEQQNIINEAQSKMQHLIQKFDIKDVN